MDSGHGLSAAAPTRYAIRGGEDGARRLDLLAHTMAPTTEALLELLVRPGMRCLDLGCGGGHVSRCLAGLVGARGVVVGLDFDPVKLEHATRASRERGLANTEFRTADVTGWRELESYDLAARTLVGFPRIFQVWGRRPTAPSRPVG